MEAFTLKEPGEVRIAFLNGCRVAAHPHSEYESWELRGPDLFVVSGTEDGGLLIWDEESPTYTWDAEANDWRQVSPLAQDSP